MSIKSPREGKGVAHRGRAGRAEGPGILSSLFGVYVAFYRYIFLHSPKIAELHKKSTAKT